MSKRQLLFATSCLAAATTAVGTSPTPAFAQGGPVLEEIVVTARRVEENLMQVPLAVTALTATDIQNAGVKNLVDLARLTPGMINTPGMFAGRSNEPYRRSGTQLTFRGLSVANGLSFIDGAPLPGGLGTSGSGTPDLTDVARVEVLKGPQAVYFGRSTYAGAINYVTKEPGDAFGGHVSGEIASYGTADLHASIEAPINDKLAFRLSGQYFLTSGQYYNPLQGDRLGAQKTTSARAYVVAKPSDALKLSALYTWSLDDDGQPPGGIMLARKVFETSTPGVFTTTPTGGELTCNAGGTGGLYHCGQLPSARELVRANPIFFSTNTRVDPLTRLILLDNIPLPVAQLNGAVRSYPKAFDSHWLEHYGHKQLMQTAHLRADYETQSGWALSSIAAWDKTKTAYMSDYNFRDVFGLPNPFYVSPTATPYLQPGQIHTGFNTAITKDWSAEVRVVSPADAPVRGTLGASYLRIHTPLSGTSGQGKNGTFPTNASMNLSKTPALFGAVYFDFAERFTLTAEARYQWDTIKQESLFPVPTPLQSKTYASFSPRVSLDYKFGDNSMAYVLFSRGYRPGGFNAVLIGGAPTVVAQLNELGMQLAFEQETLNNWEAGFKSTWFDNRLQTIVDVYYDKWVNGQVSQAFFVILPNGAFAPFSGTTNNGRVRLTGVEAEARFAATEQLLIAGTLAYMHNTMTAYVDNAFGPRIYGSTDANGYTLPAAPRWTFSFSPQYTDHLFGDFDWFARVDWTYRSRMYLDTRNIAWTAPLSLVNLRFGVTRDQLRVEVYANNLFDNRAIQVAGTSMDLINNNLTANGIRIAAPSKRVLGLKASYAF